jgi:hypothetical protein
MPAPHPDCIGVYGDTITAGGYLQTRAAEYFLKAEDEVFFILIFLLILAATLRL